MANDSVSFALEAAVNTRFDHLNSVDQKVLKAASVIGNVLEASMLQNILPPSVTKKSSQCEDSYLASFYLWYVYGGKADCFLI